MTQSTIIPYLFLATFAIALVYGVMQFFKAKKAKQEGHTSASSRAGNQPGTQSTSTASADTAAGSKSPAPPTVSSLNPPR